MAASRKPGIYIPTLYFAEGLPYTIVNMMSGVFFKSMGASNVLIGLTSLLSLPWIWKFAWSPLVDFYRTKRDWIVLAEFILAAMFVVLGAIATGSASDPHLVNFDADFSQPLVFLQALSALPAWFLATLAILTVTGIVSATQDVAIDGFYLDKLDEQQKALYVGIRNTAYRVAMIFGSGVLVYLAGKFGEQHGLRFGWSAGFMLAAIVMLVCALLHTWYLPRATVGARESAVPRIPSEHRHFIEAIRTYFEQKGIVAIVIYILIFRMGDALMFKQASNFLLDPPSKAGLGISVADIGIINGTVGVIALLVGGIFASWLISKDGLRRWMWPLTLTQSGAILLYFALAKWAPQLQAHWQGLDNPYLPAVYVINSAEQFAYGMGVAAYTVFLLSTVRSQYKAAHYATATALMALGVLIPGVFSGYLYTALGYTNFFLLSFFASLPGIVAIFFLPLWREHDGSKPESDGGQKQDGVSQAGQMGSEAE